MIGNKAVLTYKRKRFSSRPGLGFENDCPDQSHGCQTLEVLKTQVKEEEDPKHVSDTKDPEHLEVKKPFSSCVKRQDHLCSLQAQASNNLKENTFNGESDARQIPFDPHITLRSCGKNSLQSAAEKPVSTGVSTEDKPSFPLITFSRRLRHKKTVDGTGMQDRSIVMEKYDLVAAEGSNSTTDNGVLLDLSSDFAGNDPNPRYCPASREMDRASQRGSDNSHHSQGKKKTSEDVDLHGVHSFSVPKIEIETLTGEVLKDTPSITGPASDKQPEASESHVSAVDESRIISCDGLECAKISADKIRDGGSLASFDLSKPPPESSGLVDCNLTLESSSNVQPHTNVSETHRDSTESTSRSHSVVSHEFHPQGRVLELLDERIGEASLSQVPCVPARLYSSSNMWVVDLPSVSMGQSQTSKKNFLQLFPEDRAKDMLPLKNALQQASFMHPEDRRSMLTSNRKHLQFHSSTSSTASFSLSLPSEARNSVGTSLSSWPNFDTKTRELIQDMAGAQYPSDSESLMRHKMMLDNIISKARAVSCKRGSFSDNFEPPTMWSEEELDFLWIGVRRHGIGNWDAMLRDNCLHFATWRSPRELAERWEEEQSKLLSTKPPSQAKRFIPMLARKYNSNLMEEPQLSLGLSSFQYGIDQKHGTLNLDSYESRGRSTFESLLANGPKCTNIATKGKLPHWLQELVSFPPSRPVEQTTIPSAVSYTGHSGMMQWINQPFSGSKRTTGMLTNNRCVGSIAPPELWPSIVTHCTDSQLDRRNKTPELIGSHQCHPFSKPDDVIVIKSDASSEETISDDHSVRL